MPRFQIDPWESTALRVRIEDAKKNPLFKNLRDRLIDNVWTIFQEIAQKDAEEGIQVLKALGGKSKIIKDELEKALKEEGLEPSGKEWLEAPDEDFIIVALNEELLKIRPKLDTMLAEEYRKVHEGTAPSPTYIQDPVRRIVERYRRKKYLEDKPAKPFRKKPTLRTEEIIGFPPYEERK